MAQPQEAPTWATWWEAVQVVRYRPHLRRTLRIALVVGTILFAINQLDVVLRGEATTLVWIKAAVTYVVPFCVANAGVLVATRRSPAGVGGPTQLIGSDLDRGEAGGDEPRVQRGRVDGVVDIVVVEGGQLGTGDAVGGHEQGTGA